MFASDALLVDGEAVPRPRLDKAPDRHRRAATGSTRRRKAGSRSRRSTTRDWDGAVRGARRARARDRPALRDARPRAPRTGGSSSRCSSRASRRGPRFSGRARSTTPACPTRSRSTRKAGERVLFDADNERLGLVAEYDHPLLGRMRQFGDAHRLLGDARPHRTARRRSSASTRVEILEWLGYTRGRHGRAEGASASSTGPTTTTPGPSDASNDRTGVSSARLADRSSRQFGLGLSRGARTSGPCRSR